MANHKSAEKRNRQNVKRRQRNRVIKAAVRTAIKRTRTAVEAGDKKEAQELLKKAERAVGKATAKGIYHKKTAARKVSRIAQLVAAA